jgi:nucleotide-binding universal stress UspA family protein
MIKEIAVHLLPKSTYDASTGYAVSLAQTFDAHVVGISFAYEPVVVGSIVSELPGALIDGQRRENEKAAKDAVARFEQAARAAGVSAETRLRSAALPDAANLFGQMARRFDLSVVTQAEPEILASQDLIVEAALFNSGRPVVVVPYIHKGGLSLERTMIAWDGSRTAARAVGDAMPLLQRAGSVEVVTVADDKGKSDEIPGADLGKHLARHGLKVEVNNIPAGSLDIASALLSYAADNGIDFIVMGAYGHSRLREFVLGGATRGMLEAMTVPTLMSH